MGFYINSYFYCVANKVVNSTILWNVDDIKISHADIKVVDSILADLRSSYGKEAALPESRGKLHDYLGMKLELWLM